MMESIKQRLNGLELSFLKTRIKTLELLYPTSKTSKLKELMNPFSIILIFSSVVINIIIFYLWIKY